jgi:hypothetical protein
MDMKAMGSQIRHNARMNICFVGKGGVRFCDLVFCVPDMANGRAIALSVLLHESWDVEYCREVV